MDSRDVCQKIVKPMTERLQCSYVDLLRTIQHPAYREGKKADVFVSFAVNCLFLDVVDTLLSHFFNCLDSIMMWFDVFTINQHTFSDRAAIEPVAAFEISDTWSWCWLGRGILFLSIAGCCSSSTVQRRRAVASKWRRGPGRGRTSSQPFMSMVMNGLIY